MFYTDFYTVTYKKKNSMPNFLVTSLMKSLVFQLTQRLKWKQVLMLKFQVSMGGSVYWCQCQHRASKSAQPCSRKGSGFRQQLLRTQA